ncbi:aspartate--tRNA ligase, mitochondrial-like [Glandiceps talaboti]
MMNFTGHLTRLGRYLLRSRRPTCSKIRFASDHVNSFCQRSHTCGELRSSHIDNTVVLYGWVQHKRFNFMTTLKDVYGVTQVIVPQDKDPENPASLLSNIRMESVVKVTGRVKPRPSDQINERMPTGEIEVIAEDIEVLNECKEDLAYQPKDYNKVKESLRMQYRYLDIRTSRMQQNLRLRSQVVMKMREFLCNKHGFVEVETPTLFKRTPGGAREFVVPTRHPEKFYCLPQSPQQFKQLLMIGGIDRYFQFARCYRDEGSRPDRQPEFTQVDLELSFVTREDVYQLIEDMLEYSWPQTRRKLCLPFQRMSYEDALAKYGTDKPDTRFGFQLHNMNDVFKNSGVKVFEEILCEDNGTVQAINIKQGMNHLKRKDLEELQNTAKTKYKSQHGIIVVQIKDHDTWQSPISKFLRKDSKDILAKKLDIEPEDVVLLAAGQYEATCTLLGSMRLEAANLLESKGIQLRDPASNAFLWVEDFPLFLPKDDDTGIESAHHPFTAPHPEDKDKIYSQPTQVRSLHYDLVYNGAEIAGGSIRIHDANLQKYILEEVLQEDSSTLSHLIEALKSGAPPHGGIAIGFDRFIAELCNATSIRDVIAFPKSFEGYDPMSGAPAQLTNEDLAHYHIKTIPKRSLDE